MRARLSPSTLSTNVLSDPQVTNTTPRCTTPSTTTADGDGGHSKKGYAKPGTSLAMVACVADAAHDDDYIKTGETMTLHDIVKYCGDKVGAWA